jgi:hypothetical protein
MHNQHAGLSQLLAEQHRTQRWEQAAHARLVRRAHPARRRRVVGSWLVAAGPMAKRRHRAASPSSPSVS